MEDVPTKPAVVNPETINEWGDYDNNTTLTEGHGPSEQVRESSTCESTDVEGNENEDLQKLAEIQTQINNIYDELEDFYKKMPLTIDRAKYVDDVISDIESIVSSLQSITCVEDCAHLAVSEISHESLEKHSKNIKNTNQQWWDRINDANTSSTR